MRTHKIYETDEYIKNNLNIFIIQTTAVFFAQTGVINLIDLLTQLL